MTTTRLWVLGAAVLAVLLVPAGLSAKPNTLTPKEIAEGWVLLFDGKTTKGWTSPNASKWTVVDGMLAPQGGKPGLLVTTKEFGPCEVKLQYLAKASDPLKEPGPREGKPRLDLVCSRDGTGSGYWIWLYHGTSFAKLVGSGPSWVDISITLTQEGKDLVARLTSRGPGFEGGDRRLTKDRVARGHIALSGNGFIVRSIKVRPFDTKKK
jgi:hypothetical protein